MYEEILAEARRATDAAVRESQERVDLAVRRSMAADRRAADATRELGDRWASRVNAMRRREHERTGAGHRRTEMSFGPDDGAPADGNDELTSLAASPSAEPPFVPPPAYGRHARAEEPAPPRREWPADDDEDYSGQTWLEGRGGRVSP